MIGQTIDYTGDRQSTDSPNQSSMLTSRPDVTVESDVPDGETTTTCRAQPTKYQATRTRRTDWRETQRTSRDGKRSSEVDRTVDEVAAMVQRTVLVLSHDDWR